MRESVWEKLKFYYKRTFWAPFSLLLFIFSIKAFGGTVIMQVFTTVIFDWLKCPIDKNIATSIIGTVELIACGISILIIHFIGKRKLTIISTFILCIFHFLLGYYCLSIDQNWIDQKYAFIVIFLVSGIAFFSHLGIKIISLVLMGEVFPMEIRSISIGLVNIIGYGFLSIANKFFFNMVNSITLTGVFFCFAVVNLIGCIVLYFILPETEGKTLQEIEKYFSSDRNFNNQVKKKNSNTLEQTISRNNFPRMILENKFTKIMEVL